MFFCNKQCTFVIIETWGVGVFAFLLLNWYISLCFLLSCLGEFQPLKELLDEIYVNSISGKRYQTELNIKTNCSEHEHVSHYIVEHMNIY